MIAEARLPDDIVVRVEDDGHITAPHEELAALVKQYQALPWRPADGDPTLRALQRLVARVGGGEVVVGTEPADEVRPSR